MDNILCINNNKYYVEALSKRLVDDDFFVSGYSNYEKSKEFLKDYKEAVDIIIIDYKYEEGINGYQIAKKLRRKWEIDVQIIMIKEDFNNEALVEARNSGISLILPKNIVSEEKELISYMRVLEKLYEKEDKKKILIVDNSKKVRDRLKFELEGGNFNVIEAKNGEEALMQAKNFVPDYVIMDVNLSKIDGYKVSMKMKKFKTLKDIPVIFLVTEKSLKIKEKAIIAGGIELFEKHKQIGELLKLVNKIETNLESIKLKSCLYLYSSEIRNNVINYLLSKIDIDQISTKSINKAEKLINEKNIDIILIDLKNRDDLINIYKFIQRISFERDEFIPIITISSQKNKQELLKSIEFGADDYLYLPFSEEEFKLRIVNNIKLKESLSKLKSKKDRYELLSIIDEVTGAYNKSIFNDILNSFISRYNRENINFSLIFTKINNYNYIYENFGEIKTNNFLKEISKELEYLIRPTDMLFRYKDDKFVILLEGAKVEQLNKVKSRIEGKISDFVIKNEEGLYHKVNLLYGGIQYHGDKKEKFFDIIDKKIEDMEA